MRVIYNNKLYDSKLCEKLAELDHYNNGNYAGTSYIVRANDGQILILNEANGQDLYFSNSFYAVEEDIDFDGYYMDEEQIKRCVELKLIERME